MIKVLTRTKINDEENEGNETTDSGSTTFGEGKVVNNETGGKDVAFVENVEITSIKSSVSLNEKG